MQRGNVRQGLPLHFEQRVDTTSIYIRGLAIDPQTPTTLYAETFSNGGEGVFKSTNGGRSWSFSHLGLP